MEALLELISSFSGAITQEVIEMADALSIIIEDLSGF